MAYINANYIRELNVHPDGRHWIVWTKDYDGSVRQWRHRTASGALRRLGSAINGKLRHRTDCAAAVCDPDGQVWNYNELKQGFRRY